MSEEPESVWCIAPTVLMETNNKSVGFKIGLTYVDFGLSFRLLNLAPFFSTSPFLQSPCHQSPWLLGTGAALAVLCPEQSVPWQEGDVLIGLCEPACKYSRAAGCLPRWTACPTSALLTHMENGAPELPPQNLHHSEQTKKILLLLSYISTPISQSSFRASRCSFKLPKR